MTWFLVQGYPVGGLGHPDQGLPGGGGGGYPDQGLPGGGGGGERPDQGLPGRPPGFWGGSRPGVLPGRPVDPGYGIPGRPPSAGQLPSFGGRPVDPGWGVEGPGAAPHAYPGVREESIPDHPEKPDPEGDGTWILVALPSGAVNWAWMEKAEAGSPDQGLPGGGGTDPGDNTKPGSPEGPSTKPVPKPSPTRR